MSSPLTLDIDALVRAIHVDQKTAHSIFLGAGTSISSGVPSAWVCMWEWKRSIFLTKNPGLEEQFRDISLPTTQEKIQRWLDSEGKYPQQNSPEEYSFYAERCYPIVDNRRQFFQNLVTSVKPHLGYKLLCLLAEVGIVKGTWTTNFDSLVSKAATEFNLTPVEIGLDTENRTIRPVRDGEVLCVALHGDYRYDALKNTTDELKAQNQALSDAFVTHVRNNHLIIIGYSGRDDSIMEMLTKAYSQSGPGRLYWCGYEQSEPDAKIEKLLQTARQHNREAYYISTSGFDDLMRRLALYCLSDDAQKRAKEICTLHQEDIHVPPFEVTASAVETVVRSNCFSLQYPANLLQFKVKGYDTPGAWKILRSRIEGTNVIAGLLKGNVIAIGTLDDVRNTFKNDIDGEIQLVPIDDKELSYTDSVVASLLLQALVRSFAMTHDLNTNGKELLWSKTASSKRVICNTSCIVYDAVLVFLRRYGNKLYLVMKPTIRGTDSDGNFLSEDTSRELKRQILGRQWNKDFSHAINIWRHLLLPQSANHYGFPPDTGSTFRFTIKGATALAKICTSNPRYAVHLKSGVQSLSVFTGTQFDEPKLRFSNRKGDGFITDAHPIRGVRDNQPYDYALTARELVPEVRLGVVCPLNDSPRLFNYLSRLHQQAQATTKEPYLLDYPGFAQSFGIPLNVPMPQSTAWYDCIEPSFEGDDFNSCYDLSRNILQSITNLCASASPSVVVIYIPARWQRWREYRSSEFHFDLHDTIKAYCVQKGIATQFIQEATLSKTNQGEIMWWLALSFYAKSMLTPWVLNTLDRDTAYMGLGYSMTLLANSAGSGVVEGESLPNLL